MYSSDVDGVEHAPADGVLVMKTGAWSIGGEARLVLVNKDGEEVAMNEVKEKESTYVETEYVYFSF